MSLDSLDKEILVALDLTSRIGSKAIGDSLGRSTQVIEYRLKALTKRGILLGYYPVVDAFRLGFRYCRLFVQLADFTPKVVKSITRFARNCPSVLWCYRMNGDFNMIVVFWTRSLKEFDSLCSSFLNLGDATPMTFNQNQVFQLDQYQISRLLGIGKSEKITICETEDNVDIDELDRSILVTLGKDARLPYSKIAKECQTSDKVVAYRIQRMEEQRVLVGYRPIINWSALGKLFFKVFLHLDLSIPKIRERVLNHVSNTPELLYLVHGVGSPGDIDMEIVVPTYEELFAFIERVRAKFPGAVRCFSHFHLTDCYKVNYFPLPASA